MAEAAIDIRESGPEDQPAIEALYPAAFPEEDLLPLVRALLREPAGILSLVAEDGAAVEGHAIFTICGLSGRSEQAALLGPLAVAPAVQGKGIGGSLVRAGLERMRDAGVAAVCVLGDPAYYRRFGFRPERGIAPPYALPEEWRGAWQSCGCGEPATSLNCTVVVPAPWRREALWRP